MQDVLIFDRKSYRSYTAEGRLVITDNLIAREQISEYLGKWLGEGYDPTAIYRVYRPLSVLVDAIPSIERAPLLCDHRNDTPDAPSGLRCGAISNVRPNEVGLLCDITVYDKPEIERIEHGEDTELSLGYNASFVREAGEWQGQAYDVRFTKILVNHLAMVPEARAGHDVRINDSADDAGKQEGINMDGIAEIKEQLAKLTRVVEALTKAEKAEVNDAEDEESKKKVEDAEESAIDKKKEKMEDGEDADAPLAKKPPVQDEDDKKKAEEDEDKRIEDAADRIRKEVRAHAAAVREVEPVLGANINDSVDAATLYVDALAAMGVKGISKSAAREVYRTLRAERSRVEQAKPATLPAVPVFDAKDVENDPLVGKLARASANYLKG